MPAMVGKTSSQVFATQHLAFQRCCQDLISDLLHKRLSLQDEIIKRLDRLESAFNRLRQAGQMVAINRPGNSPVHRVPGGSSKPANRLVEPPMSEFDWACVYTQDTFDLLTDDFMDHSNPSLVAHSLELQSALWDFDGHFPETFFQAESDPSSPGSARQGTTASRMASRIPRPIRSRPGEASPASRAPGSKYKKSSSVINY